VSGAATTLESKFRRRKSMVSPAGDFFAENLDSVSPLGETTIGAFKGCCRAAEIISSGAR